ncbi:MAG TPA: polysaccharide biosynthesis/export family protein [Alphaproteobacteria bacterium]|nr:polysaccharide biosynthesis/export family protein [Alphaproteobacteria bacterium]
MRTQLILSAALSGLLLLAGCGGGSEPPPANAVAVPLSATGEPLGYTLGTGDRVRVTVFGELDLSGEFEIDSTGKISMPLVGDVKIGGLPPREAEKSIAQSLAQGYLANPRVNVEVLNYRPFYIIGEVNTPGSYPYVNGMSVLTAVALAGGYTYRAREDRVVITRATDPERREVRAAPETLVLPGDIIKVPERFF